MVYDDEVVVDVGRLVSIIIVWHGRIKSELGIVADGNISVASSGDVTL